MFVAFDLLYLNGYDLRKLPLTERKAVLKKTIHGTDIQFSESFEVDGGEMTNIVRSGRHVSKVPTADIVAPIDTSSAEPRQLAPFDPVYVNRLQEAFQMAGTNVCDLQAIPDAILNGT